jgi:SET domain-containing protein
MENSPHKSFNGFPVKTGPSRIHGIGLFPTKEIDQEEVIAITHIRHENGRWMKTPEGDYNHSARPNCRVEVKNPETRVGGVVAVIVANQTITPDEELTVDYTGQPWLEQPGEDWK